MNMTRRGFFGLLAGAVAALTTRHKQYAWREYGVSLEVDRATFDWLRRPSVGVQDYAAFQQELRDLYNRCERPVYFKGHEIIFDNDPRRRKSLDTLIRRV